MAVLNNTTVRRARPRARKYEITCSAVRGFVLRVLPSGKKVFLVRRHAGGQDERVRIGGAESMSCDEARVRAIELLEGRALTQRSPAPQPAAPAPTRGGRASVRTQPEPGEAPTLFAFAERYAREHVARHTKPKTQVRYRECIRLHLGPALGDVPLDEITPAAVESLHAAMSRTPSAANCTIHVLNHMYTKARDWGVL
ncbi:MAG: integrase arm-type DNA-binding domain-containing protein, partial [Myxococcales bacterium]|nr:integrase arm-type DNA-binding domain-containing protein [Myxococcales bacterium]